MQNNIIASKEEIDEVAKNAREILAEVNESSDALLATEHILEELDKSLCLHGTRKSRINALLAKLPVSI